MVPPKLHLDADTSRKSLWLTLRERGYDVTRTPNEWMALDASDEVQLLGAAAQGRVIFTYNIRDFIALGQRYPFHGGIILSTQRPFPVVLQALDKLLSETNADEWQGQVRWLTDWME
jgi:hypothetical protein